MSSIRSLSTGGEGRTLAVGLILALSTLAAGCFPTFEPFPDVGVSPDGDGDGDGDADSDVDRDGDVETERPPVITEIDGDGSARSVAGDTTGVAVPLPATHRFRYAW